MKTTTAMRIASIVDRRLGQRALRIFANIVALGGTIDITARCALWARSTGYDPRGLVEAMADARPGAPAWLDADNQEHAMALLALHDQLVDRHPVAGTIASAEDEGDDCWLVMVRSERCTYQAAQLFDTITIHPMVDEETSERIRAKLQELSARFPRGHN